MVLELRCLHVVQFPPNSQTYDLQYHPIKLKSNLFETFKIEKKLGFIIRLNWGLACELVLEEVIDGELTIVYHREALDKGTNRDCFACSITSVCM